MNKNEQKGHSSLLPSAREEGFIALLAMRYRVKEMIKLRHITE